MQFDHWYKGKNFTTDWTTGLLETWTRFLSPAPVRDVLEVGSWEGRSAIFFLEYCPNSRITCIDTFQGGLEHADFAGVATVEARFDANLAGYGDRVEKIKSRSVPALDRLGQDGRLFDVIYIDGSHARDDVMLNSLLAWRLLRQDGLMMWDDYRWKSEWPDHERPQRAIDSFLALHADDLEVVHMWNQVFARKRALGSRPRPLPGMFCPRTPRNLLRFLRGKPIPDLRTR